MRGLIALAFVAGIASTIPAADKSPLDGKWTLLSVTRDGKADDSLKGATRVHDGGKYSVTPPAGSSTAEVSGTATIDTSKTPITIDMKPASGRYKGKTLLGIATVDGDTLTIAFAEPGKERPTSFEAKKGSGVVLAVHKKAK